MSMTGVQGCVALMLHYRTFCKCVIRDDTNIHNSLSGRRTRRAASVDWQSNEPTYRRTLNSGSDSDQENNKNKGQSRTTDWDNLRGIISDDAESD